METIHVTRNEGIVTVTLDRAAVLRAFDQVWRDRGVVVVEGSDLARADAYRKFVTADQRERQRNAALRSTDRLVGRILERVDLRRDLVVITGAYQPSYAKNLGVFALHGPGVRAGLLETSTTRRAGYVALQDIAPTILGRLGLPIPPSWSGQPLQTPTPQRFTFHQTYFLPNRFAVLYRDGEALFKFGGVHSSSSRSAKKSWWARS